MGNNEKISNLNLPLLRKGKGLKSIKLKVEEHTRKVEPVITKNDLAVLDKDAELTTSEINYVPRLFDKIKKMVKDLIQGKDSR